MKQRKREEAGVRTSFPNDHIKLIMMGEILK